MSALDERHFMPQGFSQEGEDLLLRRLLQNQARGFYVDVGAHHPLRYSKPHFSCKRGWRGIDIAASRRGGSVQRSNGTPPWYIGGRARLRLSLAARADR